MLFFYSLSLIQNYFVSSRHRSRRQVLRVHDDILKKDVCCVLFWAYQNLGTFENYPIQDYGRCLRGMYIYPLRAPSYERKVYGVVKHIYILGADSAFLVDSLGILRP